MMEQVDDQKPMRGMDEYWAMVVRRRWWILGPLFLGWLIVFASAWVIPPKFTSETVILVEPQKVPKEFVVSNVQVDLEERLHSITQQVLSRPRLLTIINNLHLYQGLFFSSPDDQILQMRKDIKVDLVQTPPAPGKPPQLTGFRIAYVADKAQIAQQVLTQLAVSFIDENVRASQLQSESTTDFLDRQLTAAAAELAAQEKKIRAYEAAHMGELPEQLQSNLQILNGAQAQLQAAIDARDKALQQQAYLNSLATQYDAMGVTEATAATPATRAQQLEMLRGELAAAEARYTPDHPDVKKLKDTIAKMEDIQKDEQDAKSGDGSTDNSALTPSQGQAMTPVMQIQSQIKANKLEIQSREAQIARLEAKVNQYQVRLNATPERQQELADIARNYQESKKNYDELLGKTMSSQLATSLSRQQQGDQFRIIDPPSLPDKSSFPDRFRFSLVALGAGLALAFVFGMGSEFLDDRIRSEQDLLEAAQLPVLAEIPPLPTEQEIAAQRWKPWIAVAAAVLIAIIIPTGIWYAYWWG
ncbi:MAG TPA: Wzz/FepE/Etk N-terminal domain-containing protein [Candidatus Bathyarchaeia archaeon]|nr:Wzz/FepE/Etk N-terminal domain-containing protein [Candidatus Bathyarchaeia archaeon]